VQHLNIATWWLTDNLPWRTTKEPILTRPQWQEPIDHGGR
jgi:hypothetical protein